MGSNGADAFMINGKTLTCIVDYHSKFPVVKKVNSLLVDYLIQMTKLIFAECGVPKFIISIVSTNIITDTFKAFCRKINIQQTITL